MTSPTLDHESAFYRRLLDLGRHGELSPLLDQALALIVDFTGAKIAYLELHQGEDCFWKARGGTSDEIAHIRDLVSRGIIQATLAVGETVETPSARADPRFAQHRSVQQHAIDAVLCAPVGSPPLGVVYLQGRPDGGSFSPHHRDWAEVFASQLALVAERLRLPLSDAPTHDHTAEIRRRFRCPSLIGRSRALARVLNEAASMSPLDVGMLITGPTGTGKSALARAIHDNSRRATAPFVALNCGAIPPNLIESELFGAERGAHSTATQRMIGKVAAARGGTLFLDEIGELPYEAQTKLLHLLQERQYYPLGSSQIVAADIRVIAATNADLRSKIEKNTFRADLFFRLNVVTIEMPGLADRREDIAALMAYFLRDACARHGLPSLELGRGAILAAREEDWPGQIRELANAVEGGAIRAAVERSPSLRPHHLFPGRQARDVETLDYREATRRFQRRYLLDVLTECDWDIATATATLGLARSHLYNLISAFELRRNK